VFKLTYELTCGDHTAREFDSSENCFDARVQVASQKKIPNVSVPKDCFVFASAAKISPDFVELVTPLTSGTAFWTTTSHIHIKQK